MSKIDFYNQQNASIAHANEAYTELILDGEISDPDVLSLATDAIDTEISSAIDGLNARYDEDVAEAERTPEHIQRRIGEITLQLNDLKAKQESMITELGKLAAFYPDTSGLGLPDLTSRISELELELAELEQVKEIDPEGNEHLFAAWTRPIVNDPVGTDPNKWNLPEYFDWQNGANNQPFEDIYPDPVLHFSLTNQELGEMVRSAREYYEKDAGRMAAYLLAVHIGRSWTQQEIGDEIYCHKERGKSQRKSNASSLMNNFFTGRGSTIPRGLKDVEEEMGLKEGDLYIEEGRRYSLDGSGSRLGRGLKIYRAMIKGRPVESGIISSDGYVEEWGQEVESSPVVAEEQVDSVESNNKVEAPAVANIEEKEIKSKTAEVEQWQIDFRESARVAIGSLVERGLDVVNASNIKFSILNGLGSSSLGTRTGCYRAYRAGIVSTKTLAKDSVVSPVQVVAMFMLNSQKSVFNNPHKRKEAMSIIEEELAEYRKNTMAIANNGLPLVDA